MKITSHHIDYLNIGLIIISLIFAFILPFQLFLFSYAILGPLHYLTELNWLDEKKYFINNKNLIWIFIVFALLFAFPYIFKLPVFDPIAKDKYMSRILHFFESHINGLVFLAIVMSISFVFTKRIYIRIVIIISGLVLSQILNTNSFYNIWIGIFIPTVIHVYIFTLLFMAYGALKMRSIPGYISTALVLIIPLIIFILDIQPESYIFTDLIKQTYLATDFQVVNAKISGLLGLSDGNHFYFYEKPYLKIQIFLAFAYTYHYLNWYSKTSVIGWYKNLTTKRTLLIGLLWVLSMGIYLYDYQTGFLILLALSLLHVFAEFPLNVVSIQGIIQEIKKT
ncbi:MAG: hypothetical protein R2750_02250 [Bacteroidales bacterium]